MKRLLITGAAGFIGRHCLSLAREREIHAVTSGQAPAGRDVRWHHCDVHDEKAVQALMDEVRPDELLHLAWYTHPSLYWTSPENHRWVATTINLVRVFMAHGRRVVVAGTSAEYEWRSGVLHEETSPLGGTGPYGICKDAARRVAGSLAQLGGISLAWGRVFAVYGPGEPASKLVSRAAETFRQGKPLPMTDQPLTRDYIFVDDVARAFLRVLDSDFTGAVNIGTGVGVTIQEIAAQVARELGVPCRLETIRSSEEEAAAVVADSARLRGLGWAPQVDLGEGIRATIASLSVPPQ